MVGRGNRWQDLYEQKLSVHRIREKHMKKFKVKKQYLLFKDKKKVYYTEIMVLFDIK